VSRSGKKRTRHKESAGLLMFRRAGASSRASIEVLLAHPGGPYWANKDEGSWTIPKGGIHPGESPLDTAQREFKEETGFDPCAPFLPLGHIIQRSGKKVHAWGFEGDCDPSKIVSEMTSTEWPPKSGQWIHVPEIDRVAFFSIDAARTAMNVAQVELLDRLLRLLG
jgi:predicted NUDIX family NTP pyrophosphohydrolase